MQVRGIAGAVAALVLCLVSVAAVLNARGPTDPVIVGPLFAAGDDGDGSGMGAIVQGRLRLDDGCLLLDDIPVVWPHETGWDAVDKAVLLPGGERAAIGERVTGGGGYLHVPSLAGEHNEEFAARLRECPTDRWGQVAVFNQTGHVDVLP